MALIDTRYKFIKLDLDQQTQNIDMIFSLSDVETSDFYLQFTKNFLEINLTDYKLTLLICKPSKVVKSIVLDFDADLKAYYVNLTSEFKNIEGKYWGQALIEDVATGEKRLTKSKFSFSVIKDILSEASENITEDIASDLIARVIELENSFGGTLSGGGSSINDNVISASSTWSSAKISQQMQSIVQRLIALEGGTVVTPDPPTPTETIVGTVGADNTITLSNLESGSYTLKYEDNDGVIAGYDDIAVVEVI